MPGDVSLGDRLRSQSHVSVGALPGQCPKCGGAVRFKRCYWCERDMRAECARCGTLRCYAKDCARTGNRRMVMGISVGLLAGFSLYFFTTAAYQQARMANDPAYVARMDVVKVVKEYAKVGDRGIYLNILCSGTNIEDDDEFSMLLRQVDEVLGPAAGDAGTRSGGIRPEDILDMVYGQWAQGQELGITTVLRFMEPVKADQKPRVGDLILCNRDTIHWCIVANTAGQAFYMGPTFERVQKLKPCEDFWRGAFVGAYRPKDHVSTL